MKRIGLKNLLSLSLVAALFVFPMMQTTTIAKGANSSKLSQSKIISIQIPSEVKNEAQQAFPKHMYSILQNPTDYGYTAEEVKNFTLGNPFNVYQYDGQAVSNTGIYYFPVLAGAEIKAMLAVAKGDDGTYSSTFAPSFAKELQAALVDNSEPIRLFTTKTGEIRAISSKNDVILLESGDGDIPITLEKTDIDKINKLTATNTRVKTYNEVTSNVESLTIDGKMVTPYGNVGGPIESHYISVPVFLQGNTNYCWAGSMASMLNYNRGMNLTMASVVSAVPHKSDGFATGNQVLAGYAIYGINNPFYSNDLTFQMVASCIDIGKPCHSFWQWTSDMTVGHSMVFRGYELFSDGSKNVCLMDPHQGYITIVGHNDAIQYTHYNYSGRDYMWTAGLYF